MVSRSSYQTILGFSLAVAGTVLVGAGAHAQQTTPAAPLPSGTPSTTGAPAAFQHSPQWQQLPRMTIERQFAGPLQDTVIQRLRDPVDGTICYVYLPISAPHTPTTTTGFVEYGPNAIGSINCMPSPESPATPVTAPKKRK